MNIQFWLVIITIGLMTSCSSKAPPSADTIAQINQPDNAAVAGKMIAATSGPCFHNGTIYSNGAASCQSGLQYRCTNGEWLNLGATCSQEAVEASRTCQFSDITFPTGAASCQAGTQYRCEDGSWTSLGISCTTGDSPIRPVPGGKTCMLEGGSTVAANSTVCRSGSTFLCSDGAWVNLATQCR